MEVKPGYKQTDAGVMPEEWETHRLGELLQGSRSIRYGIVQPGKFEPTGCFMLRSQDYSKGWAGPDGMHKVSAHLENQYKNARIRHNDLIMTVVGAGIGQVVFAPAWLDGAICSRSTARIAVDESKAAPSFVKAFLESPIGKRQIMDCQKEGAQPVVSCLDLAKFFVAYPPPPEQRAIAGALSDVDALLGALDQLIAKKRDLKQAAMQQLLTGHKRLPGFHGDWEVKRLGDVVEKLVGGGTPSRSNPAFWGKEVPWVTVKDFATYHPRQTQESITRIGLKNSASHLIPAGTLITSTRMALGKAVIYDVDVAINQDLKAIFIKPSSNVHFLYYWFEHNVQMIDELGSGSTVKGISITELRRLPFLLPTLPEQTAIAEVLTDLDAELGALEQRRDKTRALKQGMMQELLTGRTRLI